jgi:hypothetical protein
MGTDDHARKSATSFREYARAVIEAVDAVAAALAALERYGLLLFSDPALPSLVDIIVGAPLRTSWWGHPRGNVIYHAMNSLHDHSRVLSTKLIAGKVTYVHQRLWPAVYSLGCAREPWQLERLSAAATWLLQQVDADGELQTDLVVPPPQSAIASTKVGVAARELERALLVHSTEVHTPSGAHARMLQTWPRWAADVRFAPPRLSAQAARNDLEHAADQLAADVPGGVAALPWRPKTRTRRV